MDINIQELEAKYGKKRLKRLEVLIGEEGEDQERYEFIAVRPSRQTIQAITKAKGDEAKAAEILVNNCIVAGDMDALDDGIVYMTVLKQLRPMFAAGVGNLKKL